ncbi:MAG: hypothetical protein INR64_05725 [Caulobacteraceae bacterium]|nr:hypothetical protein [Caulobacter sp.]
MSAWKDLVTAALLGTEKGGVAPTLPAALDEVLGPADALEREARFLTRAGAVALWRRAGWKPAQADATAGSPAPPEANPFVSSTGAGHLQALLGGLHAEALPEWLGEAARRGRRLPPEALPALLEWARQNRAHRPLALAAGGARLRWLADQNPAWNFAADDSPEHWETGNRDQRVAILRRWRAADPAQARTRLEAVWNAEPADVRAAFLTVLENGLDPADEPLLERALDDRGKEVRAAAADFLARLPGSAFAARMTTRATPLLAFKKGGLLSRAALEVTLPDAPDAAALRDGLDPKPAGAYRTFGEKAALLAQTLAAVPLPYWQQTFGQEPAALLKALEKSEFAEAVGCGWAVAALRQRDAAWAQALLDAQTATPVPAGSVQPADLACLLPEAARIARCGDTLRRHGLDHRESWPELQALILSFPNYLPVGLAQDLLRALRLVVSVELPWHLRYFLARLATKIPPKLLPFALDDWPEQNPAAAFVELLAFRRDALAALAQP